MRRLRTAATLACAVFTLQACVTLGPDYEEPEVDWLSDWETDLYGQVSGNDSKADLRFWWQAFNDPVLNELIAIARRENPTLRIAGLAVLESRALLGIASGLQYPQVQRATGNLLRIDRWPTEGNEDWNRSGLNSWDAGLEVGWELDFWGRWQRGVESADAAFLASISDQQNAQVLLAAQVAQAYYSYITIAQQIEIARENASLQERSLEITSKLFESGQSAELDVQQANTQYLATEASIPDLEISLREVENALAVLLGRKPGELPELDRAPKRLPSLAAVLIDDIPARLLMRRPDIRSAAWTVAAQSAQIGVARADLYPSISLLGSIGWSGNSLGATDDTLSTGIGPSLSWNLFNYGRIENNVRVQDARLQQAIEGYQLNVLAAAGEVDNAALSVVKTREQVRLLGASLASADRALTLSTKRYQEGYSDFQRVLTAQGARAAASSNYVINQGAHINAVITLYKALGGGWQPAGVAELVPEETREVMDARTDWGGMLEASLPANNEQLKEQPDNE